MNSFGFVQPKWWMGNSIVECQFALHRSNSWLGRIIALTAYTPQAPRGRESCQHRSFTPIFYSIANSPFRKVDHKICASAPSASDSDHQINPLRSASTCRSSLLVSILAEGGGRAKNFKTTMRCERISGLSTLLVLANLVSCDPSKLCTLQSLYCLSRAELRPRAMADHDP